MGVDVEALYRRYGPMVLRRCRSMLADEQQALDAMQDVFVRVLRRKDDLDDRGCSSLLFRVATNVCLNKLRHRKRKPSDPATDLLTQIAAAGEELERSHARSLLARALGREPESSALIAVLHLHDGWTLEETAEAVNMSVSGVRKRLRKLKAMLAELEGAT